MRLFKITTMRVIYCCVPPSLLRERKMSAQDPMVQESIIPPPQAFALPACDRSVLPQARHAGKSRKSLAAASLPYQGTLANLPSSCFRL